MNKTLLVGIVLLATACLTCIVALTWGVGKYNDAQALKTQYDAKYKANEAVFDNMFKKIAQTTQVTDLQKNSLRQIFNEYATARSGNGNGGSLAKWVQESVPNVDVSVYKNLQNIIVSARDEWTTNQVELVDVAREYNTMLMVFPSNILLKSFGFEKINATVITSTRTENAFNSGKDDDINLSK